MLGNTAPTDARRRHGTAAGGKKVKIELTSARKSKGVGRFDGVFVSKWNKLRIHRKKAKYCGCQESQTTSTHTRSQRQCKAEG
jgi:hypothetical protein